MRLFLSLLILIVLIAAQFANGLTYRGIASLAEEGKVEVIGRFDGNRAQWSGAGIRFTVMPSVGVEAVKVNVQFDNCVGSCKYFIESFVNDNSASVVEISEQANNNVTIAVSAKEFSSVRLIKRTEASCGDANGIMSIGEISVSNGNLVGNQGKNLRGEATSQGKKILFIGDSITAAYGVDASDPCPFTAATENVLHSYATLTANALNAQHHIIAWSGIGVVRNYGEATQLSAVPMPVRYNRTIATENSSYWAPSLFQADVVYVMLGTNDYSTYPQPSDDQFIDGYTAFLNQIRMDYPAAQIVIACAPMKNGNQCTNIALVATMNKVTYLDVPQSTTAGLYGCSGHPNAQAQQNIAAYVINAIKSVIRL